MGKGETMKTLSGILSIVALGLAAPVAAQEVTLDLPYLNVYSNHGNGGSAPSAWFNNADPALAARLTGTFDLPNGMAVRGSYFSFDADVTGADRLSVRSGGAEALIDAFGDSGISFFAGIRAAQVDYSDEGAATVFGEFSGVGPTVGAEFSTDFGNGLSFDASGRFSLYYGQTDLLPSGSTSSNTFTPSAEVRIGMAYDVSLGSVNMNLGGGFEFQSFTGLSLNGVSAIDPEDVDIGLAGPYLSATFRF